MTSSSPPPQSNKSEVATDTEVVSDNEAQPVTREYIKRKLFCSKPPIHTDAMPPFTNIKKKIKKTQRNGTAQRFTMLLSLGSVTFSPRGFGVP